VQHHAVPYELEAALRRFEASGYLAATYPMGELYLREIATASYYLVPFLRAYERWTQREPLSLAEGVERFLRAGPR